MEIKIFQVDAFTDNLFGGNPAAVCPLYEWLPDETMQKIAFENGLSETAFFAPEDNLLHIRWFTPKTEVDLCGHATLAAAFVLFNYLGMRGDTVVFNSGSGKLKVNRQDDLLTLDFPLDSIVQSDSYREHVEKALGVKVLELYKGRRDFVALVESEETIRQLKPDMGLIQLLPALGLVVTAEGRDFDYVSRCFFPQAGVPEDPATGSSHTTLMALWTSKLKKRSLTAIQLSERIGSFTSSVIDNRVHISGKAVLFMEGIIFI